jgi:ABC-type dipeptide/oligopeptide/nickel transport system permease subunit
MATRLETAESSVTHPPAALAEAADPRHSTAHHSNWYYARRRFFRQKLAVLGLVISLGLIAVAVFAPLIAPTHYTDAKLMDNNQLPSRQYPFGTDKVGHDFLSRVIYGVRTSLIVGFSAVAVACLIGIPLGLAAGLRGGWVDFVVLRVVEVMTAFPGLLFAIFLVALYGAGLRNIIIVIGATSWVGICRLTRAQILTLREQEYVTAARALGVTEVRIGVRHLLPNALAPLIVAVTLAVPLAIFAEAGLSFLGIGINEPLPSLGKMIGENSTATLRLYWHLAFFPTLAIALSMLGFSFVGDGLRDALDPRQN